MPVLTDAQLQGLASADLTAAGTPINPAWNDPYPSAPCWGFALFGGPGGFGDNTPPSIYEHAWVYDAEEEEFVYNPDFVGWVRDTFANPAATAQAQLVAGNAGTAANDHAPGNAAAKQAITKALTRLCMILSGLSLSANDGATATRYCIVMAADGYRTCEHWALGLANNIGAPDNAPMQYAQRYPEQPVKTRNRSIWHHENQILTTVYITGLLDGHIEYLRHAAGWP